MEFQPHFQEVVPVAEQRIASEIETNPNDRESIQMGLILKLNSERKSVEDSLKNLSDSDEDRQQKLILEEQRDNYQETIESAFAKLSPENQALFLELSKQNSENLAD